MSQNVSNWKSYIIIYFTSTDSHSTHNNVASVKPIDIAT